VPIPMRVVLAYLSGIETDSTVSCSIQESVPLALNGLVAEVSIVGYCEGSADDGKYELDIIVARTVGELNVGDGRILLKVACGPI